jgi:hypothetical protein
MNQMSTARQQQWDPYAVWRNLLHRHPVRDADPAGSCGQIDRATLAEFCEAIADYPDFLQDTLLVIAHAQGFEAAVTALDNAVREELTARGSGRSRSATPDPLKEKSGSLSRLPTR